LSDDNHYKVPYKGKVYCATVSTHILLVRRNGKPVWLGNTGEQGTILTYTQKSKLAEMVLKPAEDYLQALGYTGYIDVNCIIDKDGCPWPLEWTCRPGWPLFQIQQCLHRGDPIEWMLDLINGHDSLKVSQDIACGVVISIPDYPYSRLTKRECSGYPLFNLSQETVVDCVHLSEVQWGKAPSNKDGKVALNTPMFVTAGDYVCTVTGHGKTVSQSRDKAYSNIKKHIEIPNSTAFRTDIGYRLEYELPELHKNGFCREVNW
jgi:phosphoribosylamine---glycine ligase